MMSTFSPVLEMAYKASALFPHVGFFRMREKLRELQAVTVN
jgi:hypothetical protein